MYLTCIMSVHYPVKLKMLIAHVLQLSWYRKKLQNLFHLNCCLQICQIWIQLITACGKYCKRRCTKHASLMISAVYLVTTPLMNGCHNDDVIQLGPICFSFCFNLSRSVMHVLYTFSCSIPPYAVINCIQIWRIWRPQLRWDKLWSFFL